MLPRVSLIFGNLLLRYYFFGNWNGNFIQNSLIFSFVTKICSETYWLFGMLLSRQINKPILVRCDYEKAFDNILIPYCSENLASTWILIPFRFRILPYEEISVCVRQLFHFVSHLIRQWCTSGLCFWDFFLFLISDNGVTSIFLNGMMLLFAVDLKLLFSHLNFHNDLWRRYSWNLVNGTIVNSDKTKCIHFIGAAQLTFPRDRALDSVNSHKSLVLDVG